MTLVGLTQQCLTLAALGINYAKLHLKTHGWMASCQLMAAYYLSCLLLDSKFHGKRTFSPFPTAAPQAGPEHLKSSVTLQEQTTQREAFAAFLSNYLRLYFTRVSPPFSSETVLLMVCVL